MCLLSIRCEQYLVLDVNNILSVRCEQYVCQVLGVNICLLSAILSVRFPITPLSR